MLKGLSPMLSQLLVTPTVLSGHQVIGSYTILYRKYIIYYTKKQENIFAPGRTTY